MKKVAKLAVSLLVFAADWLLIRFRRAVGMTIPPRCVVVYYHSVTSEQRRRFALQMDHVARCTQPIPADAKPPLAPGKRYVIITFDDALESIVENAIPELIRRNLPATIFVVSDCLGRQPNSETNEWSPVFERVMSRGQLLSLRTKLVTFGSHTRTHPFLTELSESEAWSEIAGSRLVLEKLLSRRVTLLSLPYGAFDEAVTQLCRKAGYERIFSILPTFGLVRSDEFVTGRIRVDPGDWSLEFRLKLTGAYRWLPVASRLKRAMRFRSDRRRLDRHVATAFDERTPAARTTEFASHYPIEGDNRSNRL